MRHPVLLPESAAHYDTAGQNNIIEFEQETNIAGAIGACQYNIIKYRNRKKGQDELDLKKQNTFEAWIDLLDGLLGKGYSPLHNLRDAMMHEYPEMEYSLGVHA